MKPLRSAALVVAAAVFSAVPALAQESLGDAIRGEELARSVCIDCHAIDRNILTGVAQAVFDPQIIT